MNAFSPFSSLAAPLFVQTTAADAFSDDFNRADEDPLDPVNWVVVPGRGDFDAAKVVSNEATSDDVDGAFMVVSPAVLVEWLEQEVEVELGSSSAGVAVLLRVSSVLNNTCYYIDFSGTSIFLYRLVDNGVTLSFELLTFVHGVSAATEIKARAVTGASETTISIYVNSVLVITHPDPAATQLTGELVGFALLSGSSITSFSATMLTAPPPYVSEYTYLRPGGDDIFRPDGTSVYIRP